MLDKKLSTLIEACGEILGLDEVFIEKDYYVTQVIHALSDTENEYFRLVFAGGTCLAKAHKIIKRMSEDIDFKVQLKNAASSFSKTQLMKELKKFRKQIISRLTIPGLSAAEPVVRNEGRYMRIELNFPTIFPIDTSLRPHILVEFTLSGIRLPTKKQTIKTLIEETLDNAIIFEPFTIPCISIDETAIEKWVGLTRRIVAIERKYHHDDPTLVRHVYDLNLIKHAGKVNDNFFTFAQAVVNNDARQFKNQHPEYSADPYSEIQQSLDLLKNKPTWKKRYHDFIEAMVYDDTSGQEYESSIHAIEEISESVINSLKPEYSS